MIKELIKIANRLDSIGHKREADAVDGIIRKIAADKDRTFNSAAYIANRIDPRDINPRDDSDVSTVLHYIISAAKKTPGVKSPYYQIIGGRDSSSETGFSYGSNILNHLHTNWSDLEYYLDDFTEDVVHERLMDNYMRFVASLPDGDLDKENFYEEIDRIKSVLDSLGASV